MYIRHSKNILKLIWSGICCCTIILSMCREEEKELLLKSIFKVFICTGGWDRDEAEAHGLYHQENMFERKWSIKGKWATHQYSEPFLAFVIISCQLLLQVPAWPFVSSVALLKYFNLIYNIKLLAFIVIMACFCPLNYNRVIIIYNNYKKYL